MITVPHERTHILLDNAESVLSFMLHVHTKRCWYTVSASHCTLSARCSRGIHFNCHQHKWRDPGIPSQYCAEANSSTVLILAVGNFNDVVMMDN